MKKLELKARQKNLLALIGKATLSPIKIMKGMFIFSEETKKLTKSDERYEFEPYNYGPCSTQIYDDLNTLESFGYIKSEPAIGQSWKYYSLTAKGLKFAEKYLHSIDEKIAKYIDSIRNYVDHTSFRKLLKDIYSNYPSYAVNSLFKNEKGKIVI